MFEWVVSNGEMWKIYSCTYWTHATELHAPERQLTSLQSATVIIIIIIIIIMHEDYRSGIYLQSNC